MSINGNLRNVERELKGTTYEIFLYLLDRKEPVGVRQLQRELGLSSPGLASYHLEKLVRLGLVKKELGEYLVVKEVKTEILGAFVKIGRLRFPRYLFYSTFFTTLFMIYLIFYFNSPLQTVFLLALGLSGMIFLWYETLRVYF